MSTEKFIEALALYLARHAVENIDYQQIYTEAEDLLTGPSGEPLTVAGLDAEAVADRVADSFNRLFVRLEDHPVIHGSTYLALPEVPES